MSKNCFLLISNVQLENVILKFGENKTQRILKDYPSD
jgi:hypothetical protein